VVGIALAVALAEVDHGADAVGPHDLPETLRVELSAAIEHPWGDHAEVAVASVLDAMVPVRRADENGSDEGGEQGADETCGHAGTPFQPSASRGL
jgi:hypothetical protein